MKFLVVLIFVAFAVASCDAVAADNLRTDISLAQYLMSKHVTALVTNSSVIQECFILYIPLLSETAIQWETDYQSCIDYAASNRTQVMNEMSQQQADMTSNANQVCSYITNCESISDTLNYFNCFSELSNNEIAAIYLISDKATNLATTLALELEFINVNMNLCTNATERAYVETTAAIFEALSMCLKYGPPIEPQLTTTEGTTTEGMPTPATLGPATAVPTPVQLATNEALFH